MNLFQLQSENGAAEIPLFRHLKRPSMRNMPGLFKCS